MFINNNWPTKWSIQQLSSEFNVSTAFIKRCFGIPLEKCYATSAEEAERAYKNAPEGSEESFAALDRWLEFCTTTENVQVIYSKVSGDEVWAIVLKREAELSSTLEESKKIFHEKAYTEDVKIACVKRGFENLKREYCSSHTNSQQ